MISFDMVKMGHWMKELSPSALTEKVISYSVGGVPLVTYGFIGVTAILLGSVHLLESGGAATNGNEIDNNEMVEKSNGYEDGKKVVEDVTKQMEADKYKTNTTNDEENKNENIIDPHEKTVEETRIEDDENKKETEGESKEVAEEAKEEEEGKIDSNSGEVEAAGDVSKHEGGRKKRKTKRKKNKVRGKKSRKMQKFKWFD